jgi:hypothetical protein
MDLRKAEICRWYDFLIIFYTINVCQAIKLYTLLIIENTTVFTTFTFICYSGYSVENNGKGFSLP